METPTSVIGYIRSAIAGRSWMFQGIGFLLILGLSGKALLGYLQLHNEDDYYALLDRLVISVGFLILLVGSIFREITRSRKEKYANIFDRIEAISDTLKELNSFIDSKSEITNSEYEQFRKSFEGSITSALDNTAELFSMLTGTTCRTSIKSIIEENQAIYVYAFARDRRSNSILKQQDKERFDRRQDKLEDNEDFHSVFNKPKTYYFQNDLVHVHGYVNSSLRIYGKRPSLNWFQRIVFPAWGWTLPYRSAMVFPIQQKESSSLAFPPLGCIGFLTIDSAFRNVFVERYDCPIGATVANALFYPLARYVALVKRLDEREDPQ